MYDWIFGLESSLVDDSSCQPYLFLLCFITLFFEKIGRITWHLEQGKLGQNTQYRNAHLVSSNLGPEPLENHWRRTLNSFFTIFFQLFARISSTIPFICEFCCIFTQSKKPTIQKHHEGFRSANFDGLLTSH